MVIKQGSHIEPELLHAIISTSMDGFLLVDLTGNILEVNDSYCQLIGFTHEELVRMHIASIDAVLDREEVANRVSAIIEVGSLRFESTHRHKNGTLIEVEVSANFSPLNEGVIFSFIRSISQRNLIDKIMSARLRLMEFALTHSLSELLRQTLDEAELLTGSCIGFYHFLNADQKMLTLQAWSTKTATMFCKAEGGGSHYPVEQAGVWVDCVHKKKPVIHNDYASLHHKKGMPDGHAAVTRELVVPIFRNNKIVAIMGVGNKPTDYTQQDVDIISTLADLAWDVAVRKRIEEELVQSEDRLSSLIMGANDGIILQDKSGQILIWNHAAERVFGIKAEEIVGQKSTDRSWKTFTEDGVQLSASEHPSMLALSSGKPVSGTIIKVEQGENTSWIVVSANPIFKAGEKSPYAVAITFTDITERKKYEEEKLQLAHQLQQVQKLESLGVLAGGIAHDFNNILSIIIGHCSLAEMDHDQAWTHIPTIEKAAARAAVLCRQMLTYAGKSDFSLAMINVASVVDEMVQMIKATIAQNIIFKLNLLSDVPPIRGDASQLSQVVMNLIINASEAIGEVQGCVTVSLSKMVVSGESSIIDCLEQAIPIGTYACLEVSDTGCGMSDDVRQRIFEPFYSTKFTGRGLGLSAVLGIIKAHSGYLSVVSNTGQGTVFAIYLPIGDLGITDEKLPEKPALEEWQGSGTVLLVDDELQVQQVAMAMLENMGFTVMVAANGQEALDLYRSNKSDIILVISDIGMPVMDGYELFSELKLLKRDLPIIISSGFGDTIVTDRINKDEIAGMVSKPYRFKTLQDMLIKVFEDIS